MNSLASFVRSLSESGRVRIDVSSAGVDSAGIEAALAELDLLARTEAPEGAPEFRLEAALFGARSLHEGCRFLLERATEPALVSAALARAAPDATLAENIWSADLCLRYLPGLHARARAVSTDDALVAALRELSARWPLSGVGIPGNALRLLGGPIATAIRDSGALRQLLVDRVLAAGDSELAEIPWIREAIDETVGAFPELLPRSWNLRDG